MWLVLVRLGGTQCVLPACPHLGWLTGTHTIRVLAAWFAVTRYPRLGALLKGWRRRVVQRQDIAKLLSMRGIWLWYLVALLIERRRLQQVHKSGYVR